MLNFILFFASLFIVVKGAEAGIKHSSRLAESLKLSKYLVGFLLVAVISVLPETFIAVTSALGGTPAFGLGTLFGSNVADLTLVFAIVAFMAVKNVKVESRIIKHNLSYLLILTLPIILGLNGFYSRAEGTVLILAGLAFYFSLFYKEGDSSEAKERRPFSWKSLFLLTVSMTVLLVASVATVRFGLLLAEDLHVNPILVAMLFVGLGTTLPELFFSIKAVRDHHDGLALGDVLGTVITDALIIVGMMAVITPFAFSQRIVYITGIFMVIAMGVLLHFMKTGKVLTKREGLYLLFFYLIFILTEFVAGNYLDAIF